MTTNRHTVPGLEIQLEAHQDNEQRLLMATLSCTAPAPERAPFRTALVIDRSGSMSGQKLAITKQAVARFVQTSDTQSIAGIVTFDSFVHSTQGHVHGEPDLLSWIDEIEPGGSTNLYGGWLMGAKMVGRGGRVILLSDGQANEGTVTEANALAAHAKLSYEKFGVTTTTIGVGEDYDEALMAGMAHQGGGTHYFAHTADAIERAFSQERHSAGSIAVNQVSLRVGKETVQLGHFWSGETKRAVFTISGLANLPASVRYGLDGEFRIEQLELPGAFGHSDEVTLEWLLQEAARILADMIRVRDPRSARDLRTEVRGHVLKLLAHPRSDESNVRAQINQLNEAMEKLESLQRRYDEGEASIHRKRSMQQSHNLRERAKAFSSFEEDFGTVREQALSAMAPHASEILEALDPALANDARWSVWNVVPVGQDGPEIVVEMEDPRDGFLLMEMEKSLGRPVSGRFRPVR